MSERRCPRVVLNFSRVKLTLVSEKCGTRAGRFFVLVALILRSGLIWFSHHLVSRILRVSSAKFPVAFVRILGSQGRPWPVKLETWQAAFRAFPFSRLTDPWNQCINGGCEIRILFYPSFSATRWIPAVKKICIHIFIIKLGSFHYQKFCNRVCINLPFLFIFPVVFEIRSSPVCCKISIFGLLQFLEWGLQWSGYVCRHKKYRIGGRGTI